MTAFIDNENHIVISADDARGGVTGHNVRYVLEYGMSGVIAAFAAIAVYAGYERIHERLSSAFSRGVPETLGALVPYAAIAIVGAIAGWLLLKGWTHLSGQSDDESQRFMRARVVAQLAIIGMIAATAFYSTS